MIRCLRDAFCHVSLPDADVKGVKPGGSMAATCDGQAGMTKVTLPPAMLV